MIEILCEPKKLILQYEPEQGKANWVDEALASKDEVRLARTFTFKPNHLSKSLEGFLGEDSIRQFELGTLTTTGYYRIEKEILDLKHDLYLSVQMPISHKTFTAAGPISIFYKIDSLIEQPIYIGGEEPQAVSLPDFRKLLASFPTKTELTHYASARIHRILSDYFETMTDAEATLTRHLQRKKLPPVRSQTVPLIPYEIEKHEYLLELLKEMLNSADEHSEMDWQNKIAEFVLLLFPKYVMVLPGLGVNDRYTDSAEVTARSLDLALVDFDGYIDIIEIKKPKSNSLLRSGKYRDNHVPASELVGTIMQAEKYIFHLTKSGIEGEKALNTRYEKTLPEGMSLKITNPKAMLILGRSDQFDPRQRADFEIIKRKYANVVDIITYDDLLRRLQNTIAILKTKDLNKQPS